MGDFRIETKATSGTVTDLSVVTANGVSGSVATSTTTPAITLTLGAITPTSVQIGGSTGALLSAATGVLTIASIGNTNNENLTIDLESVANKVIFSSTSGLKTYTYQAPSGNDADFELFSLSTNKSSNLNLYTNGEDWAFTAGGSTTGSPNQAGVYNLTRSGFAQLWTSVSSPVNYINLTNSATGNKPAFSATGSDTDIGITFTPKGAGTLTLGNTVGSYNAIATVSNGVPSCFAAVDTTGLTANVAATTLYAVPSTGAGIYRVSSLVVETTAGSVSSTLPNVQIVYTDAQTSGAVTLDATPVLGIAGTGQTGALTSNTIGTTASGVIVINAKASTNIQYQTVNYASTAAGMAYALHIVLEKI